MSLFQGEQVGEKIRNLLIRKAVNETFRHEAAL
jgi:hypothetical protein